MMPDRNAPHRRPARRFSLVFHTMTAGVLALGLSACTAPGAATADGASPRHHGSTAKATAAGFRQVGMASWYGGKFHGRQTASGERYDKYAMTAAHRTLAFGTWVSVTNLANGHAVVVRINDRGPFAKRRIIDVSRKAAARLGFLAKGVARVRVEVIRSPST